MDEDSEEQKSETPELPAGFYRELLDTPACIAKGCCDNCGRCQH